MACRAVDAVRLLAEIPAAPQDIRIILSPDDAATASQIASIASDWPEMDEVKTRCGALLAAMPPSFTRIMGLETALRTRRDAAGRRVGGRGQGRPGVLSRARAEVVIAFDDGEDDVFFAPGAVVVVLLDGEPRVKRAALLEVGDLVVLPPVDVLESIALEMGWAGEQELLDDIIRHYKRAVAAWREGLGADVSVATIIQRMRTFDPEMPEPSSSTVRYWLSAAEDEQEPTPRASGDPRWFAAFCDVIGHRDANANDLARHFEMQRSRLRRDGHLRRGLVERFLFARYDALIHKRISSDRVAFLRERALSHIRTVMAVERGGSWEDIT
jgi:hypothetical protein